MAGTSSLQEAPVAQDAESRRRANRPSSMPWTGRLRKPSRGPSIGRSSSPNGASAKARISGSRIARRSIKRAFAAAWRRNTWPPSSASKPTTAGSPARYRVLDALATLAFDYPARAKFFRDELEQFLLADPRRGTRSLERERLLCRRDGRAAVHALELPALRRRCGCRRTHRSVDRLAGRLRERRQLPQGTRLECRRAGPERSQRGPREGRGIGRPQVGADRNRGVVAHQGRELRAARCRRTHRRC